MHIYHFELIFDRVATIDEVERLFDTCDDASFGAHHMVGYAAFHREAASLEDAIRSAIGHVGAADLKVTKVELSEPFLESVGL